MEARVIPIRAPASLQRKGAVAARPLKSSQFDEIARERHSKDAAHRASLRSMLLEPHHHHQHHQHHTQQSPGTSTSRRSSVSSGGSKLSPNPIARVRRESLHDLQDPDLDLSLSDIEHSCEKLAVQRQHQERNRLSLSVGGRRSSGFGDMLLQCGASSLVDQRGNRVRLSLSDDEVSPLSQSTQRTLRKNRLSLLSSEAHGRARAASAETASAYAKSKAAASTAAGGPQRTTSKSLSLQLKHTATPGGPVSQAVSTSSQAPTENATTVFPANDHIPTSPRNKPSLQILRMKSDSGSIAVLDPPVDDTPTSPDAADAPAARKRASAEHHTPPRARQSRGRSATFDSAQMQANAASNRVKARLSAKGSTSTGAVTGDKMIPADRVPKSARRSGDGKSKPVLRPLRSAREEKKG